MSDFQVDSLPTFLIAGPTNAGCNEKTSTLEGTDVPASLLHYYQARSCRAGQRHAWLRHSRQQFHESFDLEFSSFRQECSGMVQVELRPLRDSQQKSLVEFL